MVSERNRILDIVNYLRSLGIEVNIGKNKARGNQGFFRMSDGKFRIDIAKKLSEEEIIKVLTHEFAHFIHYQYDKNLISLNFIIDSETEVITEELIEITVSTISKTAIAPLFKAKEKIKSDIKDIQNSNKIDKHWQLHFLKKALNRINSKISRLNKYYNMPTELFARSIEAYITNRDLFVKKAPELLKQYDDIISKNKIPLLSEFYKILL